MTGFENGSITLDDERKIYYAGQVLTGRIDFALSQPLVFTAIKVQFHGVATVLWREIEVTKYDGMRLENTVAYTGHEAYFNVVQCVCGGVGVSALAAGSHSIPFRFQIPPSAPSSLDGRNRIGGVSHYVKACMEFPDGRGKAKLKEYFKVIVPLDLNLNPEMKRPIVFQFEEFISSCFCGSGPLTLRVCLPAAGYCPGQAIPIQINANNHSYTEIHRIIFELVRREKFHTQNPPSDRYPPEVLLAMMKEGPILARTKRSLSCELLVPAMIAPVLDNCGIIDVEFFFKVKLRLSGCNDDLENETQIWLGFVPLVELTQGQYTHPMQSDLPEGPIPNLNEPPEIIQPYVYPSITLENKMQPVHHQNVSNSSNKYQENAPANTSYPGPAIPYPGDYTPYPSANFHFINLPLRTVYFTNPPYSETNPPYPYPDAYSSEPYPPNPPPYTPSASVDVTAPGMTPGYSTDAVSTGVPSYKPSAPPF